MAGPTQEQLSRCWATAKAEAWAAWEADGFRVRARVAPKPGFWELVDCAAAEALNDVLRLEAEWLRARLDPAPGRRST